MPTFNFPATPAFDEVYTENGVSYIWDGTVWRTGDSAATPAVYVQKIGDTMTGPLMLPGVPSQPLMATDKKYVDETIAAAALYQGVWSVAANIPDLDPAVAMPLNGYSWIAQTQDPNIPETAPATLPGIGGDMIAATDTVKWNAATSMYEQIRGANAVSSITIADEPPAGAFIGQLWWDSNSGKHYVWFDDGTSQQWIQISGGGGGKAGGIPDDAPADGLIYGRKDLAWAVAAAGVTVSDTAPTTPPPTQGELWFNSTDGSLLIWYDDGTSSQWVDVTGSGGGGSGSGGGGGLTQADADLRYLQLIGGSLSGNMNINTPSVLGNPGEVGSTIFLNKTVDTQDVSICSNRPDGRPLWKMTMGSGFTQETGTDAGHGFQLVKYNDGSGGAVNLGISRQTGNWEIGGDVTIYGIITDALMTSAMQEDPSLPGKSIGELLLYALSEIKSLKAEMAALIGRR